MRKLYFHEEDILKKRIVIFFIEETEWRVHVKKLLSRMSQHFFLLYVLCHYILEQLG